MDAQLSTAVIHDLKNSLGLLEGELALLAGAPRAVPGLRQAHETCSRLRLRLIAFLTVYQAETGRLQARVQEHNPEDFLREVEEDFGAWSGPRIEVVVAKEMTRLAFFDGRLVGLALHAALSNAKAFAKKRIVLGARPEGRRLVFFVLDDGPGLGETQTPGGTGLGLTVARQVAAAHARGPYTGEASMKNAPQGGALFELSLP